MSTRSHGTERSHPPQRRHPDVARRRQRHGRPRWSSCRRATGRPHRAALATSWSRRGAPPGLRPGPPVRCASTAARRGRLTPRRARLLRPHRHRAPRSATRGRRPRHRAAHRAARRRRPASPTTRSCSPPARARSCRRSPGTDLPGVLRLPHDRRPRRHPRLGGPRAVGAARSIGGGLLGLEAANALRGLGLETHVVEFAPRLMPVQLDDGGGRAAAPPTSRPRRRASHSGRGRRRCLHGDDGRGRPGSRSPTATRPRRRPGRVLRRHPPPRRARPRRRPRRSASAAASSSTTRCRTIDPRRLRHRRVRAATRGRIYGLVAPGYEMAARGRRPAAPASGATVFTGADTSTKLKLLGVDVASVGRPTPTTDARTSSSSPTRSPASTRSSWSTPPTARVLGGVLVGDAAALPTLLALMATRRRADAHRHRLVPARPAPAVRGTGIGPTPCPTRRTICSCNAVTKGTICAAVADGCHTVGGHQGLHQGRHRLRRLRAAGDRSCSTPSSPKPASTVDTPSVRALRPHPPGAVRARPRPPAPQSFAELRRRATAPAAAARSASRRWRRSSPSLANGYILDGEQASLQDTNDHFLANIQRDGTYSVVPRVPGGEITPDAAHRHRRGRPRLRPLHEDHRRPAHRPVRRPRRAAARRSGSALRRRRLRVRPRLRQGACAR